MQGCIGRSLRNIGTSVKCTPLRMIRVAGVCKSYMRLITDALTLKLFSDFKINLDFRLCLSTPYHSCPPLQFTIPALSSNVIFYLYHCCMVA